MTQKATTNSPIQKPAKNYHRTSNHPQSPRITNQNTNPKRCATQDPIHKDHNSQTDLTPSNRPSPPQPRKNDQVLNTHSNKQKSITSAQNQDRKPDTESGIQTMQGSSKQPKVGRLIGPESTQWIMGEREAVVIVKKKVCAWQRECGFSYQGFVLGVVMHMEYFLSFEDRVCLSR